MNKQIAYYASFVSILLLTYFLSSAFFAFTDTDDFVVGEATAFGVSIGNRIRFYYSFITLSVGSFLLFYFLFNRIKYYFQRNQLRTQTDSLVFFGIILGIISFTTPLLIESVQLIAFFSLILMMVGNWKNASDSFSSTDCLLLMGLVFISGYTLFHSALIGGIYLLIFTVIIQRKKINHSITKFVAALLIFSPFIAFLGVESSLILNQRAIYLSNYIVLTTTFLLLFLFIFYWVNKKRERSVFSLVYTLFIPVALINLGVFQHYTPVFRQVNELFETANFANPVMQAVLYGEIPIFDNLSSHLVSDFFWPSVYSLLNGYQSDSSILMYSEFHLVLYYLAAYFFLYCLFGKKPWISIALILLPASTFIIPLYYSLALIPFGFAYKYHTSNKRKFFYWFLITTVCIVLWRLDIGISLLAAILFSIPLWFYFRKNDRKMLVGWLLLCGSVALTCIALFGYYFPASFSQMLGYFGANQAHGLHYLTSNENNIYYFHYTVLPLIVAAIFIHTVWHYKHTKTKSTYFVIILLALFYFFNLQRGLVRHSFAEGNDTQIASFAWLILFIKCWTLFRANKYFQPIALVSVSALALFLSFDAGKGRENLFQKDLRFGLRSLPKLTNEKLKRVELHPEVTVKTKELVSFIDAVLKKDETFIDFSNTPLLYYYSGKNVPSYFNQYLQNTVTEKLQFQNIEELKRLEVPLVVFSQVPETFYDQVDNIPNKVRHFVLCDYIYQHYEPWTQVGNFKIWKKKNWKNPILNTNPYPITEEKWNLGLLPYFWKQTKSIHFDTALAQKTSFNHETNKFTWTEKLPSNQFLKLKLSSKEEQVYFLSTTNFQLQFQLKKGTHDYLIPLGCSENIKRDTMELSSYTSQSTVEVKNYHFVKFSRNED